MYKYEEYSRAASDYIAYTLTRESLIMFTLQVSRCTFGFTRKTSLTHRRDVTRRLTTSLTPNEHFHKL